MTYLPVWFEAYHPPLQEWHVFWTLSYLLSTGGKKIKISNTATFLKKKTKNNNNNKKPHSNVSEISRLDMKSITHLMTVYWNDCPCWIQGTSQSHRKINSEAETQAWNLIDPKTFHDHFKTYF